MAGETPLTVVGNVTADPELRYTQGGIAAVAFTVASTPRTFDRQANSWKDGETLFLRCIAWREHAENIAGELAKGMNVIVQGNLAQRSYDDRDQNRRTVIELQVTNVGRTIRRTAPQGAPQRQPQAPKGRPDDEPWSTPGDDTPF